MNVNGMNVKRILFEEQRGRCATCEGEGEIGALIVDHDHKTGFVRGLLCLSCNTVEGRHQSSHLAFKAYRANPPGRNRWRYEPTTATGEKRYKATVRLTDEQWDQLHAHCFRKKTTMQAFVIAALADKLERFDAS